MSVSVASWLLLYAAVLFVCGHAIHRICSRSDSPRRLDAETLAISLALGIGGLPWILLTGSMLGIRPTRIEILAIGFVGAIVLWHCRSQTIVASTRSPLRAYAMAALALLLIQAVLLIGLSLAPTYEQDAVAIWGLKARVLYFQSLRPMPDYFSDLSLSFTHLDYPLLLPMLWAGAFAMQGHTDETISKLILLLPTLAIAGLIYGLATRRLGRSVALLLAALAVGSATTTRWAAQGLADQLLALFILAAAVALVRFIERRRWSDACLAGMFAGFAAITKLEGLVLHFAVELILLLLMLGRRRTFSASYGVILAVLIYTPWPFWSRQLPHTHENYQARLTPTAVLQHLDRLPEVTNAIWAHFHFVTWWPILFLPLIGLALNARAARQPHVLCVWLILLALLTADVAAYLVTPWPIDWLVSTTLERLLLQITPLMLLLAVLQWPAMQSMVDESNPSASENV